MERIVPMLSLVFNQALIVKSEEPRSSWPVASTGCFGVSTAMVCRPSASDAADLVHGGTMGHLPEIGRRRGGVVLSLFLAGLEDPQVGVLDDVLAAVGEPARADPVHGPRQETTDLLRVGLGRCGVARAHDQVELRLGVGPDLWTGIASLSIQLLSGRDRWLPS